TTAGWRLRRPALAARRGRRVRLGGQWGNLTVSWAGWAQSVEPLRLGRLLTAYRQWRMYYRNSPHSRSVAFRKLFIEPLAPEPIAQWAHRRRHGPARPRVSHTPIRPQSAAAMGAHAPARERGPHFVYRPAPA